MTSPARGADGPPVAPAGRPGDEAALPSPAWPDPGREPTLDRRLVWGLVELGRGAAAGLAGGLCSALLCGLGLPGAAAASGVAFSLRWGVAAGLVLGVAALLLPPPDRPGALIGRWLRRGPAGPGDRGLGLLIVLVVSAHLMWLAGAWVDSTFHHRLLSAGLLTACAAAILPFGLGLLRLLERLSGRFPGLALLLAGLAGAGLGLRLAWGPSPGALLNPLAVSTGLLEAAVVWTLIPGRPRLCLAALLLAPWPFLVGLIG